MNGRANHMISETIKKSGSTLEERGLPSHSYFVVTFKDGSSVREHDVNWSAISEEKKVKYFGGVKTAMVCVHPVSKIEMFHGEMSSSLDVPDGCEVYQAVRGYAVLRTGETATGQVGGRVIGLVKDGEVIEEQFLDGMIGQVRGLRK